MGAVGGAARGRGGRSISRRAKNGWRREVAGCGGASRDLANEPDGTHVPIFCKQRDGGPRGAYGDAIVRQFQTSLRGFSLRPRYVIRASRSSWNSEF